jgi:hypothetical protein
VILIKIPVHIFLKTPCQINKRFAEAIYLTTQYENCAAAGEVSAANVTKINVRFKPGKELTEALAKVQLRPVESLTNQTGR